jgi:NAD(P)-dependent dehydrogenase (short-subunit alcohol dehydrogenase family)
MNFQGKNILLTGANRGIGRALVDALLQRSVARIYAGARSPQALASLADVDARVVPVRLDVRHPDDIRNAVQQIDRLDVLINNAGSLQGFGLLDSPRASVEADFDVNFWGPLALTRGCAPKLRDSQGAVLNMLTLVSMASMPAIGGYSASKAAAWSMTQALRKELGADGVTVFAAYPGAVDTDMIRSFEMAKTPPEVVACNVLDAMEGGELDSFPDPMSKDAGAAWLENPRALEAMFGSM